MTEEKQEKSFRVKLHPFMDEKTLNAISDTTLEAIGDQLYRLPQLTENDIGKEIKNEGIYLGIYRPADGKGVLLEKIFHVFAAPKDLPRKRTYKNTIKGVAGLRRWYGHSGTNYATDKELLSAIRDGRYKGGWIVPPRDILCGRNVDGKETAPDNILAHKNKNSLKGTFKMVAGQDSGLYWSSSENPALSSFMLAARLSDGATSWMAGACLSCRPVRLVPIR